MRPVWWRGVVCTRCGTGAAMLTPAILARCWPRCPPALVEPLAQALAYAMSTTAINTVPRAAAFLGQLAWECNEARMLEEPRETALAYEGRRDLGNVQAGDGVLFRGRGLIHLTGRDNYRRAGLEDIPERAASPEVAAKIAAWYWAEHGCNELVDAKKWREVTERINGLATDGPPSYHEKRMERINRCAVALGGTPVSP